MIINTGMMLERLTNGVIPTGIHRVVAAPGYTGERYSVVQFCHPTPWTLAHPAGQLHHPGASRSASPAWSAPTRSTWCSTRSTSSRHARRVGRPVTPGSAAESETRDVVLAIDIGGTKLAAGLMTMQGELIDRDRRPVDHDLNADALFASLDDDRSSPSWSAPRTTTSPTRSRSASAAPGRCTARRRRGLAAEHRRVAVVPAASSGCEEPPACTCTAISTPRRWPWPRDGWGGAGHAELPGDGRVHRRRRRDRAQRPAARRGHRQRRPRRPHRRRAERSALRVRFARLPRGRGIGPVDRGHHRSPPHRADLRDHAAHRPARRPAPSPRCATCSISIWWWSAAPSRSASARRSSTRRRRRSTSTRTLSFSRGARITPARLGDRAR